MQCENYTKSFKCRSYLPIFSNTQIAMLLSLSRVIAETAEIASSKVAFISCNTEIKNVRTKEITFLMNITVSTG